MNNEKFEIEVSDPEFRNTLYFRMLIVRCSRLPNHYSQYKIVATAKRGWVLQPTMSKESVLLRWGYPYLKNRRVSPHKSF